MDDVTAVPARRARTRANPFDRDWLFAIALAFMVGVCVWFGRSIKDFFGPSAASVLVPSFAGQTLTDAQGECDQLRVRCVVIANQPSDRYPKDVVMNQQPVSGARVREGRQISLIVSTGVTIYAMPDLRYESLRNVNLDLAHDRLQLDKTTTVANDDIPANHVVSQNPAPLTSVREGSRVSVVLSKGPPSAVKVPSFVNMDIDSARSAAESAHVHIGQVVWTPFGANGPARGVVVRQRPDAGQNVDPFEPVSLQVSAGPTEYGYLVRQVHVGATVPARQDEAHVRMEVRDETGTWNVYDGFAQGGQKLDFNLTVVGTAELDTYLDNELLNATKLGVEPPNVNSPRKKR